LDKIGEFWRDAKASVIGQPPPARVPLSEPEIEKSRRNGTVNRLLAGLYVSREEFTRVIRISFTFENPKLAADAANTLADVYVQNTLDVKYAGTREAAQWLNEQLAELRQSVEESEAAAEQIRQGEALVQGRSTQMVSEQISALNRELIEAKAKTDRIKGRLSQIEELRRSPNWEEHSTPMLESDLVQALRLEKFKLEREAAELSNRYGKRHPKIMNIRAEIADVQSKIQSEFEKYVTVAHNELAIAQSRERSLRRNLNALNNQVGDLNQAEIRLRALEREAEANRTLYEAFLARYKQTNIQEEVQQPDARVLSYAEVPRAPSYPPKNKYLYTAIAVAVGLGLALVYALEMLDKGFRTVRQVEQQTGLHVLGIIPSVNLSKEHAKRIEDLITRQSHSRFTESINLLYSHLKWPADGGPAKTVLVSSALPKEGKTSIAISLARRAAYLGDKTLLIDGDFRHPHATRHLGLQLSPGLSELLANDTTLENALQKDDKSGAYVLSPGRGKEDPVALIGSEGFRVLLKSLKESFDLIIFDSSPILAVAEAQLLARVVDQTLVLVRWGKTPRQATMTAIKQLQEFGARVSGVALTQVNLNAQSYYGYGEYGYYTNQMKGYYTR
jgi:capsular exopolysaccharide synthesis family protein